MNLDRKNWEEHDAGAFKSIQCKSKELYDFAVFFKFFSLKKLSNVYNFVPVITYILIKHCANFYKFAILIH